MAHKQDDRPPSTSLAGGLEGAKPTWVVDVFAHESDFDPWEDHTLVDERGFVLHTIELKDAPAYVVPITFRACRDDPTCPAEVTLEVEVRISAGAFVRHIDVNPRPVKAGPSSSWPLQGMAEYEHLGPIELKTPTLLRDALAHAAMPASRPHVDEIGYHAKPVLALLPDRRDSRKSTYERDLMRDFYAQVLRDGRYTTKVERLQEVYARLHAVLPDQWPYDNDADRSTADYSRLRPFFREMDAELKRGGGWPFSLKPGSFTFPDGWLDDD